MKLLIAFLLIYIASISKVSAQKTVKANEAYKFRGKVVTVCDTIYNGIASHYTGLFEWDLGCDKAHKRLVVLFTPSYIYSLTPLQNSKRCNTICVTGLVEGTKDTPILTVKDSSQVKY